MQTRALLLLLLVALLGAGLPGCRRRGGDRTASRIPSPAGGAAPAAEATDAGASGDMLVEDARSYPVRTWSFPLDRYDLTIEDVGMTTALGAVLERTGGEVAVNGGFFGKDEKPLGLAISAGRTLAPLARSLSGGVVSIDGDTAHLTAAETFTPPDGTRFAIQCRPRLVVDGAPNVKSDDGKRSERTALCVRDGGKTIDLHVIRGNGEGDEAGPSLFALGRWLAQRGCEGALNLDGGPSTGVAWREGGEVRVAPPRGPVRHAIVFKKR